MGVQVLVIVFGVLVGGLQDAATYLGMVHAVPVGLVPSEHAASVFVAIAPPLSALNETLVGDSTAGARAVVPAVTVKVTVVIRPVASAMVNGTMKPPHPSATPFDVKRKMPPWLVTTMTCPVLAPDVKVPAFGRPLVTV